MKSVRIIKALLFFLVITIFLSQCNNVKSTNDQQVDITEGRVFISHFYSVIKNKNFSSLDGIASDTLKKIIGNKGLSNIGSIIYSKVGDYKNYIIISVHTQRSQRSGNETIYNYKLQVTYEKGVIVEILGLKKTSKSAMKVISYNVYSDLLTN